MKLAFAFVLLLAFNVFADNTNSDCIPRRSAKTGEIEGYDCSLKNINPDNMTMLGKVKSVKLVKSRDEQIKLCLKQVYQKQSDFKSKNSQFASSFNDLNVLGDANCRDLKFGFIKSAKNSYEIVASNDFEAWTIDNLKNMTKIK